MPLDWHFDQDDIGYVLSKFIIPSILDTATRQYEQMDRTSAQLEDFFPSTLASSQGS